MLTWQCSTWLDDEEVAYPSGGFLRKGSAIVVRNRHAPSFPVELLGKRKAVRASIPDTFYTIPARLRYRGKTYKGFLSFKAFGRILNQGVVTFTPEAEGGEHIQELERLRGGRE